MSKLVLVVCLVVATLVASSPPAVADDVLIADPAAQEVTALDGTIVWVSGEVGAQVLMRSTGGLVGPVPGAPPAHAYRSTDLGRDARGNLVLTYLRCASGVECQVRRDDLQGHRRSFPGLEPVRCGLSTPPAVWRARIAYGLACATADGFFDPRRSGLYVKRGSGLARRLPLPPGSEASGIVTDVDLRGPRAAAVATDVAKEAFVVGVDGADLRWFPAGASEGETDQHVAGFSLGPGGVLWTLVVSQTTGEPDATNVYRLDRTCLAVERLVDEPDPGTESQPPAVDLAVDGPSLLLLEPGRGIVTHTFMPLGPCQPI